MKKLNRLERYAFNSICNEVKKYSRPGSFMLSDTEISKIEKIRKQFLLRAGFAGAIGVVLLYFPYYFFPELFPEIKVWLFLYDDFMHIPVTFLI